MFAETLLQRRAGELDTGSWAFWGNGFGGTRKAGLFGDRDGWRSDSSGYGIGAETLTEVLGNPVLFGVSLGYSESAIDSRDSFGDVEAYHLGAFARTEHAAWQIATALSYAMQDFDFERALIGPGFSDIAYGETEGSGWTLKSDAFYDLNWAGGPGPFAFGPVATLDVMAGDYDSFKETGAGILNLTYIGEDALQTVLGLGGQGQFEGEVNGWGLETSVRVVWESLDGDRDISTLASFDNIDGQVAPRSTRLDASRVALGLDTKLYLSDGIFAHIRYDTTHSQNALDHKGTAGITIAF